MNFRIIFTELFLGEDGKTLIFLIKFKYLFFKFHKKKLNEKIIGIFDRFLESPHNLWIIPCKKII
jgi:hypothetical protein